MKRGIALPELILIASLIGIVLFGCIGYLTNLYKLTQLDFKAPYKAEYLRIVGVGTPIGAVIGFIDIKDE